MQGTTSIAFEENQLSPSLFSLSLQSTTHPLLLQQEWVRASKTCYRLFTLVMDRSPGFGSTNADLTPISDSVSLRLPYTVKLANASNSLTHYTKGTQSPIRRQAPTACTQTVSGSISLPSPGFFSPFPHGTSSLSVSKEYLALDDGPPIFNQNFSCSGLLVRMLSSSIIFRVRGFHPLQPAFPNSSTSSIDKSCQALPRSLAATKRISFDFFSFGYLDVSVPRVRS